MNKLNKILIAIIGGIDTTIYMFTPIILAAIWVTLAGTDSWLDILFYGFGLFATLFRAIKIGWKEWLQI